MLVSSAILTALLPLAALADFHVLTRQVNLSPSSSNPVSATEYMACPSNYFNCNCYGGINVHSDRGVGASASPSSANFSVDSGLCGMGRMNFYHQTDGSYKFYADGGDGSVLGTCYKNSASDWCAKPTVSASITDGLVCYSYICN